MKKLITLTIALFLLAAGNVFAQISQNVTVSANVESALAIDATQNVVFGTIQQLAATLDRASADPNAPDGTNLGSTAQLGIVEVTEGSINTDVIVEYTNATLGNGTDDDITFTTLVRDHTNGDNITSGATVSLNGSGELTLHIGGELEAPTGTGTFNTETGDAPSPVTVTVQYL